MPGTLYASLYCIKWTGTGLGHLKFLLDPQAWLLLGMEKQTLTQETALSCTLKVHPQLLEEKVREREGEEG